jgi:hypothetical protein
MLCCVKSKGKIVTVHPMMVYGGEEVSVHSFLTLPVVEDEWPVPQPLNPRQRALVTHSVGGWVGPSPSFSVLEKEQISYPCQGFHVCAPRSLVTCVMSSWLVEKEE